MKEEQKSHLLEQQFIETESQQTPKKRRNEYRRTRMEIKLSYGMR
jgi:hypothetical protein